MKRQFLFSAVVIGFFAPAALAYNWSTNPGDGSPGDPYQISTAEQLDSIGTDSTLMSKHFIVVNDIDMSGITGTSFHIIGNSSYRFGGSFDGQGYTISNFSYVTTAGTTIVGLFGYTQGSDIKNVILDNVTVSTGGSYVGGLVGFHDNHSTMTNCSVSGTVSGNLRVGGLAGQHEEYSLMADCQSTADVQGTSLVGGLVGEDKDSSRIVRCMANGRAAGFSSFTTTRNIGGLAGGTYYAAIEACRTGGTVTGDEKIGGLVGYNYHGTILRSAADANVIGDDSVGGLTGVLEFSAAENSYACGIVSGTNGIGGLVGEMWYSSVEKCYSTGPAAGDTNVGGLVGYQEETYSSISDSYWDTTTSTLTDGVGNLSPDPAGVNGRITSLMKQQATFSNWDFVDDGTDGPNNIWRMCADDIHYPKLSWEAGQFGDYACPDGVGMDDLETLALNWLTFDSNPDFNYAADGSGDGMIDQEEMGILSSYWQGQ